MADENETIIADEQNEIDESNDTETETSDDEYVDVNALQDELAKAKADKEKWEARYKSTKKQESKAKPVETKETKKEVKEVDLDSLVERKLAAIEEQRDFIKEHGQETFDAVKVIKEKHPTLSYEDALKISSIASDPATSANPDTASMWGRPNIKWDSKTITQEQLNSLSTYDYRIMRDRMKKWEVTLK